MWLWLGVKKQSNAMAVTMIICVSGLNHVNNSKGKTHAAAAASNSNGNAFNHKITISHETVRRLVHFSAA